MPIFEQNIVFLPPPNNLSEDDVDYVYFGWIDISGDWLVRRQSKVNSMTEDAIPTDNLTYGTLTLAWVDRVSLTYN